VLFEHGSIAEVIVKRRAGVVDEEVERLDAVDGCPEQASVRTWLYRIATNRSRDALCLTGSPGGSYSLRILVRGKINRGGAQGSPPTSRTLRVAISGCQQSGSIRLIAKSR
jgi:hypothetical protein